MLHSPTCGPVATSSAQGLHAGATRPASTNRPPKPPITSINWFMFMWRGRGCHMIDEPRAHLEAQVDGVGRGIICKRVSSACSILLEKGHARAIPAQRKRGMWKQLVVLRRPAQFGRSKAAKQCSINPHLCSSQAALSPLIPEPMTQTRLPSRPAIVAGVSGGAVNAIKRFRAFSFL